MNFEMSRVYRDIIEEVMRGLKLEQDEIKMTPKQINDLKNLWGQKLREMTTPTQTEMPIYGIRSIKNNETIFPALRSDKIDSKDSFEDLNSEASESDSDEKLEAQHPNYMMCLYDKVDKSKDRWRVKMKQGFLNIGKNEYAFDTAHGSLYW